MASVPSSAQQALETPEILEMVLSCLRPLDLLLLQRTSQLWNGLISTSPQLQRILFMRPDWQLEGKKNVPRRSINKPGERPKNNLLLRKVLGGAYPTMTLKLCTPSSQGNLVDSASDLDPDIVPKQPDESATSKPGLFAWDISLSFPADDLPCSPTSSPAIYYEKASWKRMYLSQPPATTLHLCRRWQRAAEPAVHCEEGITMEDFVEKALKAKDLWNELFIGSDRDWHFEGPIRMSHFEEEEVTWQFDAQVQNWV